jgi:transcription antitermination factor NusG
MSGLSQPQDAACEWFAVQVWAGREPLCATHLSSRGYHVFLPSYREHRRWSDRTKIVDRAVFQGYLFCRLSDDVFAKVVTTPGVIRIVGDGSGPLPVAAEEIHALQRVMEHRLSTEPWEFLRAGERVRIQQGPLTSLEGIVLRTHGRHRLIVSVTLLQRSVAVEIDPGWVDVSPCSWLDHSAVERVS